MSEHEPSSERTDGETNETDRDDVSATRREILRVTGGTLLGSAVLGDVTDVARAGQVETKSHDPDPAPGDVDWSRYIENQYVVGENAEPPHVPTTMPYGSREAAIDAQRGEEFLSEQWLDSAYVQSLNGAWQFHFAQNLGDAATDASDDEAWDTVQVPHCWNTDGYGFINYDDRVGFHESMNSPPAVPSEDNYVGTYKREFDVADGWTTDRRTFLRIGAAKACAFVWVNDAYVGYKQGSMTPGEFDVTEYVDEDAANTVTIQVVRWTDGTYLEQGDMMRYDGIYRDVLLYSKPDLCVRDFHARPDLDDTYTDGALEVDAAVANYADGERTATLRARLTDPSGTDVATATESVSVDAGEIESLDENSQDGVRDHSRDAHDTVIHGDPVAVDGVYDTAFDLSGDHDWIEVPNEPSLDLTGALTVEAILQPPADPAGSDVPLVTKGHSQYGLELADPDTLRFFVYDPENGTRVTADAAVPDGWEQYWHRVTGVYDGSNLLLYLDGERVASTSYDGSVQSTDDAVGVGYDPASSPYGDRSTADLTVDAVRIYDRGLSAAEAASERTVTDYSARLWLSFDAVESGEASPLTMDVPEVQKWSAEQPTLYTLTLELVEDASSSTVEAMVEKVGFRKYEVQPGEDGSGDVFTVNGEPVTLNGTNRHEHDDLHGRHVGREQTLEEIELLKRHNFNAVRLSHYPQHEDFYRLADEYGLYVNDEVNGEAHGNQDLCSQYPWHGTFFDRFYRMVERDKNFPSINIWGTGNEAGRGEAHFLMAAYANSRDGTRMLFHQGGTAEFDDILGPRYIFPSLAEGEAANALNLEGYAKDDDPRPVVMGEYAHAMGNSAGGVVEWYDVIREYDTLQGGYVWDWINQAPHLTRAVPDLTPDASGGDHHGEVHGDPALVDGPDGNALDLDGDGDWVEATTRHGLDSDGDDVSVGSPTGVESPTAAYDLTDEFTVEAVVRPPSGLSGPVPLVTKGDTQYGLRLVDETTLQFFVHDGEIRHAAEAAVPAGWADDWHAVAGVYDGEALRLYADGTERAVTAYLGPVNSNTEPVAVGHNTELPDRDADLAFDRVSIWERALGAGEVGSASSPDDSTALWYDFDVVEPDYAGVIEEDHRRAVVEDESPSRNVSDVRGTPSVVSGRDGTALEFASADDWVDAGNDDSLDLTGELTVEAVVPNSIDPSAGSTLPLVAKGEDQYALGVVGSSDGRRVEFGVSDGDDWHAVSKRLKRDPDATWRRITGVYDEDSLTLYVDGTKVKSKRFTGSIHSNHSTVGIGSNPDRLDRSEPITVDAVRIYDRALSAEEVGSARDSPDGSTRLWLEFDVSERHRYLDPTNSTQGHGRWFCDNGTVFSDRTPMPEMGSLKHIYQPVSIEGVDPVGGTVEVTNRSNFTDLGAYDVTWALHEDDKALQAGTLDLDVPPNETATVDVGYEKPDVRPGADYWFDVSVRLADDEAWAPAGHEVAFEQLEIPFSGTERPAPALSGMPEVSHRTSGPNVVVSGDDFAYAFNTELGRFVSIQRHGEEFLAKGPEMNAWREPVLNERAFPFGVAEADDWYRAGLDRLDHTVVSTTVERPDPSAVRILVQTEVSAPDRTQAFVAEYAYHVLGSGDVLARVRITPNADMKSTITQYLPKYGLQLHVRDDFDRFEWYGRGPEETYPDKKQGQRIGRHSGSVADQFVGYLPPQDYGNKCDARFAAVTNDDDVGLLAFGQPETPTLNASVQAFTDMASVDYNYQLDYAEGIAFNVDYDVSGVGCSFVNTRPPYRVTADQVEFVYGLRPFDGSSEDPLALSRRSLPYSDLSIAETLLDGV